MEVVKAWPEPCVGRFWAAGWQQAERRFGQQSFVLEHTSPGTGTLLNCPPRHWCCFYFLCSFIFSALLPQRGQVPSSLLAQGRLQQLHLASLCTGAQGKSSSDTTLLEAGPSPRPMFPFSCLYFGLNDF